jgi:hypothetical protein
MAELSPAAKVVLAFHRSKKHPTKARPLVGVVPDLESDLDLRLAYAELVNGGYLDSIEGPAKAYESRESGQVEPWSTYLCRDAK